jgi:hypothetical protein
MGSRTNEVVECPIVSGLYPQLVAIESSRVSPSHDKAIGVKDYASYAFTRMFKPDCISHRPCPKVGLIASADEGVQAAESNGVIGAFDHLHPAS